MAPPFGHNLQRGRHVVQCPHVTSRREQQKMEVARAVISVHLSGGLFVCMSVCDCFCVSWRLTKSNRCRGSDHRPLTTFVPSTLSVNPTPPTVTTLHGPPYPPPPPFPLLLPLHPIYYERPSSITFVQSQPSREASTPPQSQSQSPLSNHCRPTDRPTD